jgi:hypothetical protein
MTTQAAFDPGLNPVRSDTATPHRAEPAEQVAENPHLGADLEGTLRELVDGEHGAIVALCLAALA